MTLDPKARQVRQLVTTAPSPATSGVDFHIDHATTYELNGLEQTVPFKITVFPNGEAPTKQNSEIVLVQAYTPGTRLGTVTAAEVTAGAAAPGSAKVDRSQAGDAATPQSEIQTLTLVATGGTFTLAFGGQTTAPINWNDAAATIQTRLQALSSIGASNVTVSGSAGSPFTITFAGSLANAGQSMITADATLLTFGKAGSVAVARVTAGGGGNNEVQTVTVTGTAGSYTLSFGGQTTVPLSPSASPATVQTELQALSSIGAGNVAVTGQAGGPYSVTFQGAMANTGESLITADATLLVRGGQNEVQTFAIDADAGTFRLSADGGSHYTSALAFNASAATVQAALQALSAIGSGNCVVTYDSNACVYTVTFVGALAATAVGLLTVDASSLTVTTAHVTSCLRAQDGSTARSVGVGDLVEVAKLNDSTTLSAPLASGTYNDWTPSGFESAGIIFVSVSTANGSATISGLTGGTAGRMVTLILSVATAQTLTLKNLGTGSAAANRFLFIDGADRVVADGGTPKGFIHVTFQHDGTQWREIAPGVSLFNQRAGDITPQAGDYNAAQVTNAPDLSSSSVQTFAGGIKSSSAAGCIGYTSGAGNGVSQGTSRTAGVTTNRPSGQITTFNNLTSGSKTFTVTCSSVVSTDTVVLNLQNQDGTITSYFVSKVQNGSFDITYVMTSASTAYVFNFAVIKAVIT